MKIFKWILMAVIMLTITENTTPYFLPTVSATNAQRVLSVLQTHYCIDRCNPLDEDGFTVNVATSGTDYLISRYNPTTGVEDDDGLGIALFDVSSGSAPQQDFQQFRGVSANRDAVQEFSNNTPDYIDFTAETIDTDGYFAPTSDTITIPAGLSGYYQVNTNVRLAVNGPTVAYVVTTEIHVNGSQALDPASQIMIPTNSIFHDVSIPAVLHLEQGDTVQVQVTFTGGTATNRRAWGSISLYHVGI